MQLKLTFKGRMPRHADVVIYTRVIAEHDKIDVARRFFELEQTFNELTTGRLHVELLEEDNVDPTIV